MKRYRWIVPGVILLLVLGGASVMYRNLSRTYIDSQNVESSAASGTDLIATAEKEPAEQAEEQEMADDFSVYDKDGNEVHLSDYRGRPVVVNFWASWCPPCKQEMPAFQKMWEKYGEEITFLMVNETDGERERMDTAQAYVDENGYKMDFFFDLDQDAAYTYYLMYLPRTLFIDAQGNLVQDQVGQMTESELEHKIEKLRLTENGAQKND